jgi:hypothetical protein
MNDARNVCRLPLRHDPWLARPRAQNQDTFHTADYFR